MIDERVFLSKPIPRPQWSAPAGNIRIVPPEVGAGQDEKDDSLPVIREDYTRLPPPGTVLSQEESGYVNKGPFGCKHCQWFGKDRSCPVIGEKVHPDACCDYNNDPEAPMRVGKSAAEYIHVLGATYRCDECSFWVPGGKCEIVSGAIAPGGSCNKYQPGKIVGKGQDEDYGWGAWQANEVPPPAQEEMWQASNLSLSAYRKISNRNYRHLVVHPEEVW